VSAGWPSSGPDDFGHDMERRPLRAAYLRTDNAS
jgi:hypothetical protein